MGLFGEAVLAPAIVAVRRFLIRKVLKILGFRSYARVRMIDYTVLFKPFC